MASTKRLSPSLRSVLLGAGAMLAAGAIFFGVSVWAAQALERRTAAAVTSKLLAEGITWAEVTGDGLRVRLAGTAPTEAQRFRALNLAGSVIDAGRVRDELDVTALRAPTPPRFSVEMLRNDDGLSLVGLVPGADASALVPVLDKARATAAGLPFSNMLEAANWPVPEGWPEAMDFGTEALALLPRSKVSVAADRVTIKAIAVSESEKRRLEAELARRAPEGLAVQIDISAPRPVLTPFTLRIVIEDGAARFDACSADTERARDRILAAAVAAGATGKLTCTLGLGVPTPRWAEAAEAGIRALAALGRGTLTFADADVSLVAGPEVSQAAFDRTVGELQAALPPVFSLNATLTPRATAAPAGPAEFTATRAPEGKVELRGRLGDALLRDAVDAYARARFGAGRVLTATRLDPDLPAGWPVRVLAGLEALAELDEGALTVRSDIVAVSGIAAHPDARARIAQILSGRLGPGQTFRVDVRYDEARDPEAALPPPEVCAGRLNDVLAASKIVFAPGSAEISSDSRGALDALAAVLRACPPLRIEIAGHTDSQGSEAGNLRLSQARAEAVLVALAGRRVPTEGITARGYGEQRPIADNATEAGREANRRIEFALLDLPATPEASATPATDASATQAAAPVAPAVTAPSTAAPPAATATLSTAGETLARAAGPGEQDRLGATRGLALPETAVEPVFEPVAPIARRPQPRKAAP